MTGLSQRAALAAITCFGAGNLRPASGTWGSLAAVALAVLAWLCAYAVLGQPPSAPVQSTVMAIAALLACVLGILLGPFAIAHYTANPPGRRSFGKSAEHAKTDPSPFVLDEVAGQWLALAFVPADGLHSLALSAGLALVFFRIFDIVKLWPANRLERLPAGWGICLDDMLAGLYAGLAALLIQRWLADWIT